MILRKIIAAAAVASLATMAIADDDPRHVRHELMEDVRDAAKVVGAMLKGERDYDQAAAMGSLKTWEGVAEQFGGLFPEGSETGEDTEAAPAIWEDRAGFDAALQDWQDAVGTALAANAATLDDARPLLGAVMKTCKGCHDKYRIESE